MVARVWAIVGRFAEMEGVIRASRRVNPQAFDA